MANFAVVRQNYVKINKEIGEAVMELRGWQTKLNGVQTALESEVGTVGGKSGTSIKTIQAAEVQSLPSSPRPIRTIGGVLALAMAAGAALVFLMNFFDRTISTTDKAKEFFDLPVHGVIGEIVSKRQLRWRWFRKWVLTSTVMVILLGCVAIAAMSIFLKLQRPEMFNEWASAPLAFVSKYGQQAASSITTAIRNAIQ